MNTKAAGAKDCCNLLQNGRAGTGAKDFYIIIEASMIALTMRVSPMGAWCGRGP